MKMKGKTLRWLMVIVVSILFGTKLLGEEKLVVIISKDRKAEAPVGTGNFWNLKNYGIKLREYQKSALTKKENETFAADLNKAQMLVFNRELVLNDLLDQKFYAQAIEDFLKRGGTLFFQYNSGLKPWGGSQKFFERNGLGSISRVTDNDYHGCDVNAKNKCPLLTTPNDLSKRDGKMSAYGVFPKWPETQILVHKKGEPDAGTLLLLENVLGKGKIIISRLFSLTSSPEKYEGFEFDFIGNLVNYVWGVSEKGNVSHEVVKEKTPKSATNVPVDSLNCFYLRNLQKISWWNKDWAFRIPLIVREPLGENRENMTVTLDREFPAETDISSIRVLSVGGREIPCQATLLNADKNLFRVSFADDIEGHATNCYFIYFDYSVKTKREYDTNLSLSEKNGQIILRNKLSEAVINAQYPIVSSLRANGASTDNPMYKDASFSKLGSGFHLKDKKINFNKGKAKIVEDGPVRKVIEYSTRVDGAPFNIRFSLELGSGSLFYELIYPKRKTVGCAIRWLPGLGIDGIADSFYYPSLRGIKKVDFGFEDRMPLVKGFRSKLGEGWYAFTDNATKQTVGMIFDLSQLGGIKPFINSCWGYTTFVYSKLEPGKATRLALLALPDNSEVDDFRDNYLLFKNPPQVALAASVQKRENCPSEAKIPQLGQDFIGGYHLSWWSWRSSSAFAYRGALPDYFNVLFKQIKDRGYNMVDFWAGSPKCFFQDSESNKEFLKPMEKEIKANGMSFFNWTLGLKPRHTNLWEQAGLDLPPLPLDNFEAVKESWTKAAKVTAKNKADVCFLADESTYRILPGDKALFRKTYGMDPVMKVDIRKLSEPRQYNTVLFQMDAYTEIMKSMAVAAKKANPDLLVADQVNISSMCDLGRFGAPHDWERMSDYLDTVSMDLYGAPRDFYKYWNKFQHSMFDNKKPVMVIMGCTTQHEKIASSIGFFLMWGVKILEFFDPRNTDTVKAWDEVGRSYSYFNFTGLGDLMVRSNPQKHIALFRDRAGMINAIKTGQWNRGRGNKYDVNIANITYVKNLQTDIVMSKYFSAENLKEYPILYVADDPAISDKFVDVIAEYANNGGIAIVEGETIRNKKMRTLTGVAFEGKVLNLRETVSGADPFSFNGKVCSVKSNGAKLLREFTNGSPVLFEKKTGKGKILYLAPVLSSKIATQDDIAKHTRKLFQRLAGKQIITVEGDNINEIDSNILDAGDGNYIFCAWNPNFESKTVTIKWNGKSTPEVIVDFAKGVVYDFKETFSFDLPRDQVKQFFIGRKGIVKIPESQIVPTGSMSGYSANPGKNILNYKSVKRSSGTTSKRAEKLEGISYVAVFNPRINKKGYTSGAKTLRNSLRNKKGLKVEFIQDLKPETISYYDAVIVPNIGYGSTVTKNWEKYIREYVLNGGSVFLNHRTVGYAPCEFPPFPEVGQNSIHGVVPKRDVKIVGDHPLTSELVLRKRYPDDYKNPAFQAQIDATAFTIGDTYRFGFCDYVPLKPGKNGTVIMRGCETDNPMVIAGKAGKGKVVLAGMSIGQDEKGKEKKNINDEKLLINSVYWLTDK
jgi:hypothetical protein